MAILKGAACVPNQEVDNFRFAPKGSRHIGVLHNGFSCRIAALDARNQRFRAFQRLNHS